MSLHLVDDGPMESTETDQLSIVERGSSQSEAANKKPRSRTDKSKVKTGCPTCRFVIEKPFISRQGYSKLEIYESLMFLIEVTAVLELIVIVFRKRHIKCDEGRPGCKRCLKAGIRCEGYSLDELVRSKVGLLATRPLLPRESATLTLARPSSLLLNESEVERRYFQHFHDQTMSGFSMNFDNSLWNRLVLQTSRQEPFVRYAVIAIGAISKSLQADPSKNTASQTIETTKHKNEMENLHRKFAFLQYSKSLKEMKDIISKAGLSPRQALLASLLSFCFENFIGNRPVAMYHAQAGHKILQNWMSEHPHSISHNVGLLSPAPHVVEDDLVHAFAQLDLQILTIADARGHELHDSLKHFGDDTIENMPIVFRDINEARVYWDVVMARSYHFLLTAWEISRSEELARPFITKSPSHTFITNSSKTLHSTPNIITEELLRQQRIYAAEISRWHSAFHPIWVMLLEASPKRELLMATMILINCLALEIMVAAVAFPGQSSYDEYWPLFQEIVDLIETNVTTVFEKTARPLDGGFLLDLGITCPLGLVAMRCRDRIIRRKAIAILRSWFTEGPTDPVMISKVSTFIMEIEEEGNEFGIIPESSRAFPTLYCLDPVNNTILMQFCQRTGGPDGGPIWREKKFDW